jgi:hypothetical protein
MVHISLEQPRWSEFSSSCATEETSVAVQNLAHTYPLAQSLSFLPPPPPRSLCTNNWWSHTYVVQLILCSTQRNPPIPCGRVDARVGHDEHRHNLQQLRVLALRECPGTRDNLGSVQRAEVRGHVRCLALPLRGERGARVRGHVFDVVDEEEARERGERELVGIRRAVLALPGKASSGGRTCSGLGISTRAVESRTYPECAASPAEASWTPYPLPPWPASPARA